MNTAHLFMKQSNAPFNIHSVKPNDINVIVMLMASMAGRRAGPKLNCQVDIHVVPNHNVAEYMAFILELYTINIPYCSAIFFVNMLQMFMVDCISDCLFALVPYILSLFI